MFNIVIRLLLLVARLVNILYIRPLIKYKIISYLSKSKFLLESRSLLGSKNDILSLRSNIFFLKNYIPNKYFL